MAGWCYDCGNLDKTHKECGENEICYIYGCKASKQNHCCGYMTTDNELKKMGCSDWKQEQTTRQTSIWEVENG